MPTVHTVAAFLEHFAPSRLAEEWDNVGLLVGDPDREVRRLMTCLTITPASAEEAIAAGAELIVSHHPLPFRALKRLTTATTAGRLLLELAAARVAVFSPHTAFDSAPEGINQRLAQGLALRGIVPLVPGEEGLGTGRWGWLADPLPLDGVADRLKAFLALERLLVVGRAEQPIRTVAIGCGAADDLVEPATRLGCDCMVLGEARFHTCLEAQASGMALLLPGHYSSERFALVCLAEVLSRQFPDLEIWPSRQEHDVARWQ